MSTTPGARARRPRPHLPLLALRANFDAIVALAKRRDGVIDEEDVLDCSQEPMLAYAWELLPGTNTAELSRRRDEAAIVSL